MPRKSDPASSAAATRRSLATFVLADDHEPAQENLGQQGPKPPFAHTIPAPASARTPTPTSKPKSKPVPIFAPAAPAAALTRMASSAAPEEMDTDRPSESVPPSDKKGGADSSKDTVAIEDLNLPKSIITRLAKGVLPPNTQIQANAILAMTKSATVFINHLASAANERTLGSGKKTILPDDVFEALDDIEYSQFRERLQAEFKKFNETRTTKRNTYRRRVAAAKKGLPLPADPNASMVSNATSEGATEVGDMSTASAAGAGAGAGAAAGEAGSSEQQPRSKKAKTGGAPGEDSAMDMDDEAGGHTEPEDEVDEEEDEEDEDEANQDDESGDEDEEEEMQDAMEERENAGEEDEALDNGDDSDA
ncbi:hypothetical protein PG987_003516 [Apiospora arundinis]